MIKIYNRTTKNYDIESVAGKKYIDWCYESLIGKAFTEIFIKRKLFTKLYGSFCDSSLSKKKIKSFISDFNIDMKECEKNPDDFNCFNDFFTRKLKETSRPFSSSPKDLISPGDGRLLVYPDIKIDNIVQVKDFTYSLRELVNDDIVEAYEGGICAILRLCPLDYHRFHFVDNGICTETHKIKGSYYSVNPVALNNIESLFCKNKREWNIFKSENFGDILQVDVGATCVGTIVQTYTENSIVSKGDERGYFKFGGSTTILFFKKDTVKFDDDILQQSKLGIETHVLMGETIGKSAK